jgi:DNA anti-recombination protein RmuC
MPTRETPMGLPMPQIDLMSEAHEERIQRLESNMEKVVAQTSASSVKLDHLTQKIDEGFRTIGARFEKGTEQFEEHSKVLTLHKERIQNLQQVEAKRASRWKTLRKMCLPLLIAAGTAIATHFGEQIWTLLSHL